MKHGHSRRIFAAVAVSALSIGLTQAATGQQADADLAGPWRFKSAVFDSDCTMSGGISLKPAAKAGSYTCSMIVETHCRNNKDGVHEYWRVKETCTAKQVGQRVQINGKIERVEDATLFGEKLEADDRGTYVPDNFELTLQPGNDEMKGQMVDRVRRVAVDVWREAELVS